MKDDKYETLIKEVREISSDIARLDADLTKDRHDLEDFRVQMSNLTAEVKQSRREVGAITDDVGDKVKDTLKPAVSEVTKLKEEIKKKKTIIITKNKLFDRIKQRFVRG